MAAPGDVRLPEAAMQNDVNAVRLLLQQKADINASQGDGMTALHWAVYRDNLEMARSLVQAGADVKRGTRIGAITPLFVASSNGNAAMVELLLKAGADPNSANELGTTALMQAAGAGNIAVVTALVSQGADVNAKEKSRQQTPLMFASARNRAEVVKFLASRGARLDEVSRMATNSNDLVDADGNPVPAASRTSETRRRPKGEGNVPGIGGLTALHYAARDGHIETVRALVEAGANVNRVNPLDKSTPLIVAAINGQYDIAMYLLEHGADPNLSAIDGLAPLYATLDSRWAPVAWTPTASSVPRTT